jgi:hypothetical protein
MEKGKQKVGKRKDIGEEWLYLKKSTSKNF